MALRVIVPQPYGARLQERELILSLPGGAACREVCFEPQEGRERKEWVATGVGAGCRAE